MGHQRAGHAGGGGGGRAGQRGGGRHRWGRGGVPAGGGAPQPLRGGAGPPRRGAHVGPDVPGHAQLRSQGLAAAGHFCRGPGAVGPARQGKLWFTTSFLQPLP